MNKYLIQAFEVAENTNVAADFEPAISIDHINVLVKGIKSLQELLGITSMKAMASGNVIKRWKTTVTKQSGKVAEGEVIPLSKTTRVALDPIALELKKYRKQTTAEAIQKNREIALNESDDLLMKDVRSEIVGDFYAIVNGGTGTATAGTGLQSAAAQVWGALQVYYEDMDVTPVFFINPLDAAGYLANAAISTQTTFGIRYIENFLGLGTAIINSRVTKGTVVGTAVENLNGAYVPAGGDTADIFGLTFDESGLVGMTHGVNTNNASVDTLIMTGVKFYAEDVSGIFKSSFGA
ncbi:MAG: hypothetical protein IJV28_04025 [Paludibacteraceae bacterium]|nr:hypothetical protein [Paludibacteraceae bacterium]MBQ7439119.1 hypothetical protein [Paludibacteraceae bacterium]